MKTKLLLLASFLFISVTNCTSNDDDQINCTQEYAYGLNVTLIDSSNSNIITTDVEVTATDGDYEETLITLDGIDSFFGAGERPGNYTLTVTSNNYVTYTTDVIAVSSDVCHVIGESIEIPLTPN